MYGQDGVEDPPSGLGFQVFSAATDVNDIALPFLNPQTGPIYVEGAENPKDAPISIGERYAKTYVINLLRCIYCGYCVEACPTEALQMKGVFELAAGDRASLIVSKDQLLATLPKHEAEDSWMPS